MSHLFQKGNAGGPGRPSGSLSGRGKLLGVLDQMLAEAGNLELFRQKIREKFNEDPLAFFKTYVMPLLPKDINLELSGGIKRTEEYVFVVKTSKELPPKERRKLFRILEQSESNGKGD